MNRTEDKGAGNRAHRTGLVVNLGLAVGKTAGGWAVGSQALLSDGLHSLSDGMTNAIAWLGFRYGRRPADDDHPYGHGRFETLAALVVGFVLGLGGLGIVWSAFAYGHGVETETAGVVAIAVAVVSVLANLYLAWLTWRAGRALDSPSLLALARDNGADVLTSLLVVPAVAGSLSGVTWAEPLASAFIGMIVAALGLQTVRQGLDNLTGRVDPELGERLARTALAVEGVRGVQRTRIQPVGSRLQVDMEVSVDGSWPVSRGHEIAHAVERAVREAHEHVVEVQVHVNPAS